MKQKIVLQVPMDCDKCRSKALKIASVAKGHVEKVELEGKGRDRVVVVGEDIDSFCLAKDFRKKFGHVTIVSVEEVKKEKKEEKREELRFFYYPYPPCPPLVCEYRNDTCTIM